MAKITISDITAAFAATTAINARFQQIEDEFASKVMYTDEVSPMERDLDMAGYNIINVNNVTQTGTPSITATNVVVTPVGSISSINAQAALAELDSEKAALAGSASQNFAVNNLTVTGTVDGRDVSVDGTKLDTVETNADVTDAANVATAGAMMDSDISPAEGILRKTGAGTYTAHKTNLVATGAPTVNADSSAGYSVNSEWVDLTNDNFYKCVDSTVGAAVWILAGTSTPGGVSSVAATAPITSSGGATPTIALSNDGVTNAKLANMATQTIKGRTTAGTGDPEDLTAAQARSVIGLGNAKNVEFLTTPEILHSGAGVLATWTPISSATLAAAGAVCAIVKVESTISVVNTTEVAHMIALRETGSALAFYAGTRMHIASQYYDPAVTNTFSDSTTSIVKLDASQDFDYYQHVYLVGTSSTQSFTIYLLGYFY